MSAAEEIARELAIIRSTDDVIPYMMEQVFAAEVEFRPLPADMLSIIRSSPDFRELVPGGRPTRLQFAAKTIMPSSSFTGLHQTAATTCWHPPSRFSFVLHRLIGGPVHGTVGNEPKSEHIMNL